MVRHRSSLGFFFLTKVPLLALNLTTRRGRDLEDIDLKKRFNFLILPIMVRRRLYSRLLILSSGSTYLDLPSFVSIFTRKQSLTRAAQVTLRHAFLTFFSSLQVSNKYILIDAPYTLTQLQLFKLNVWLYVLNSTCRFVFTTINITIKSLNSQTRYWLFYLWSLSWHFRYFRMPPQPLLLTKAPNVIDVSELNRLQTLNNYSYFSYTRWALLGFRNISQSTPTLLKRLLHEASDDLPLRDTLRGFTRMVLSPKITRQRLGSISVQNTLYTLLLNAWVRVSIYTYLQVFRIFNYTLLSY